MRPLFLPALAAFASCLAMSNLASANAATFGDDLAFLSQHTEVLVLRDRQNRSQLVLAPAWQGRVMTSTDRGSSGLSYGWINRELIQSRALRPHINAFGGEDRFWLGPEGGQFSIFFPKGVPFDFEHWQTPASLDTVPFEVVRKATDHALFRRFFTLTNYSGTRFELKVEREVRLLKTKEAWKRLGVSASDGANCVAYETVNRLVNVGRNPWHPDTGLLSIWILGMFNASPDTTVVVPIREGSEAELGPRVNADYFGPVPADRLVAQPQVVFFRGDGQYRSKIGISPKRARPQLGSFDAANQTLTLVQYTLPSPPARYVNSQWKIQTDPFSGDVVNSYSDDGKLGAFYELESSSPASALEPGQSVEHVHRTIHVSGSAAALNAVARANLGVGLDEIRRGLPAK